jgi:hypothetical protein
MNFYVYFCSTLTKQNVHHFYWTIIIICNSHMLQFISRVTVFECLSSVYIVNILSPLRFWLNIYMRAVMCRLMFHSFPFTLSSVSFTGLTELLRVSEHFHVVWWNLIHRTSTLRALQCGRFFRIKDLRVRFPAGDGNFYLHHRVQNGSEAHPASYPMGTRGFFPEGKAAGAWSWPLTSI